MRGGGRKTIIRLMKSVVVRIPVERMKTAEALLSFSPLLPPIPTKYMWTGCEEPLRELGE